MRYVKNVYSDSSRTSSQLESLRLFNTGVSDTLFDMLERYTEGPSHERLNTRTRYSFKRWIDATISDILESYFPFRGEEDPGVYVGLSGIAFMLWKVAQTPGLEDLRWDGHDALGMARIFINRAAKTEHDSGSRLGFFGSSVGTRCLYAALNLPENGHLNSRTKDALIHVLELYDRARSSAPSEVLYGKAGFLYALRFLKRHVLDPYRGNNGLIVEEYMQELVDITQEIVDELIAGVSRTFTVS